MNLSSLEKIKFFHSKYFYLGLVILTITAGALFLIWPMLSGQFLFPTRRIGLYHYMYFSVMQHFVYGMGMLPNWWPAYNSGYPINLTLDGFLNPIFILSLKYLTPFFANNLMVFLFFIATGLSLYALARALQLSRTASLVSAISYAFGGVLVKYAPITATVTLMPFLPLSFLCCVKILQGKMKWLLLWLLLLLYSWFEAWEGTVIYPLVAVGFFAIYLAAKNRKSENFNYRRHILFFGAIILSVAILSPWFLSVLHFISYSSRSGGMSLEIAANAPITLSHFIHMIYPRLDIFYGELLPFIPLDNFGNILYVGTLPLLLILASFFIKAKKEKEHLLFFFSLAAGSILMVINHSPLFWLFHQIPVLRWFQGYWKWSFIIVFSLAILAGYGMDNIKDFFKNRFSKHVFIFLWILIILALLGGSLFAIYGQKIKTVIADYGISHYRNTPDRAFNRSEGYYQNIIGKMADSLVDAFSLKNKWFLLTVILWFIALAHLTIGKYELISSEKWKIAAILVTLIGSTAVWTDFLKGPPVSYLKTEPDTAKFLHSVNNYASDKLPLTAESSHLSEPYRIFHYLPDQYVAVLSEKYKIDLTNNEIHELFDREMMDCNIHIAFNFDMFINHQPLSLRRLEDVFYLARQQAAFTKKSYEDTTPFDEYIKAFSDEKNLHLLGALNIQYILTPLKLANRLQPIFTTYITNNKMPIYIYRNPYFMPRWYFANEIKWTKVENKTAFEDFQKIEDFKKITLLEMTSLDDPALSYKSSPNDKIELELYTAGKLILKTNTKNYRFLVFSESRFPDFWQAFVNNEKVPIYTANYLYQAVLVPPGKNTVEFRYPNLWEQSLISLKSYINSL